MANLIEKNEWTAGIYQLEEEDPVLGGENGVDNLQAKQLANRTVYLKKQIENVFNLIPENFVLSVNGKFGEVVINANDINALTVDNFESRMGINGYQKLPSGLIIQWCSSITNSTGSLMLTLPIAFPNNLFNVVVAEANGDGWDNRTAYSYGYVLGKSSRSTIKILSRVINPGSVIGAAGRFSLIAIGN